MLTLPLVLRRLPAVSAVALSAGVAFAQDYQYRFGGEKIPPASADEKTLSPFSSAAAKHYLDHAASLWAKQQQCVSCHTHGIYSATRPALSPFWGAPSPKLRSFLVRQSRELEKSGPVNSSSPAMAAYLARGLAAWDAQFAKKTSPETDAAIRNAFDMQVEDGSIEARNSWPPLNSGTYYGTAMTAMAIAAAPAWLENLEDASLLARIEKLHHFLRSTEPKNDHERTLLLWTSTFVPGLLEAKRRQDFIDMIWEHQREDGGWSIRTFATLETWGGGKKAEQLVTEPDYANPPSDGYQTGFSVVVLRDAGVPADDPRIAKAVQWLRTNQRESGRWWTRSLNTDSRFHYITYSGSAYASLALAKCDALEKTLSNP